MTTEEFSNQFDVLYNNITSNQAPGLDEYEKSVFLTKAQNEIILSYFNPKTNKTQEGFDGNERRQIDFSMLMETKSATVSSGTSLSGIGNTKFYKIPDDLLLYINEVVKTNTSRTLSVVPLQYGEFNRLMSKPYKRPLKNQAWRLIHSGNGLAHQEITDYGAIARLIENTCNISAQRVFSSIDGQSISINSGKLKIGNSNYLAEDGNITPNSNSALDISSISTSIQSYINMTVTTPQKTVELIPGPGEEITSYMIRYIRRPSPIVLGNLDGVTIENIGTTTPCELDPIIHEEILQRAVELAKAAYAGDLQSQLALGINSETEKGMVAAGK